MEITPFAGYRVGGDLSVGSEAEVGDESGDTEDGGSWGISAALYRDPTGFYEVLYSGRNAGLETTDPDLQGAEVRIEYLHFGGTLLFPQPAGYETFISATVGLTRLDARSGNFSSEQDLSASLGGGFRIPLTDNLSATLGARGYWTLVESDTGLVCVSTGGEANCLLQVSGSSFWEVEAMAGLTIRF